LDQITYSSGLALELDRLLRVRVGGRDEVNRLLHVKLNTIDHFTLI
jgi:hypothetical protein